MTEHLQTVEERHKKEIALLSEIHAAELEARRISLQYEEASSFANRLSSERANAQNKVTRLKEQLRFSK